MNKLSIKDVVRQTGLSENYIRKSIMSGKLAVTKEVIPGTKIEKNWITEEDFNKWNETRSAHSKRDDGRNKFVLYMNKEEQEEIEKLLKQHNIDSLKRAYVKPVVEVTE